MQLLFSILIIFLTVFSGNKEDEIRWSTKRNLVYTDFSGTIPSASPWAANTSSNIYFSYDFTSNELREVIVYSSFTPSKSWMRTKISSVLIHEQLHFDITELFARRLTKNRQR